MSIPPPRATPPAEEESGVHQGFYEHSTGGKVPIVPPALTHSKPPPPRSLWGRLLSWLGLR